VSEPQSFQIVGVEGRRADQNGKMPEEIHPSLRVQVAPAMASAIRG
jgi:hypothetical protein